MLRARRDSFPARCGRGPLGQVFATVALGDKSDVDAAVAAARKAVEQGWAGLPPVRRVRILNRLAGLLRERTRELAELESLDVGKPLRQAEDDVAAAAGYFEFFAGVADKVFGSSIPLGQGFVDFTLREPLGVSAQIVPWNYPLRLASRGIAPALAAGNAVVAKPAAEAGLSILRLAELAVEAGLPAGVFNVVTGGRETGAALASHPGVKKIVFTGGTDVGRSIGAAAAQNFALTTLELGGKGAVLIFEDMPLERAVNGAAFSAFIGAGQTCVCGARILVQRSIYDRFLAAFAEKARAIRVGDPSDPRTQLGPVISERSRARILGMLDRAKAGGAKVLVGGGVPRNADPNGYFLEPTAVYDVDPAAEIAQEEVFGPFTVIMPFEDEADALRIANGTRFGLAAGVWTNDVARAHRVASKLTFGMVWINDHHRLDPASPWGGFKDSGVGRETGTESFDQFTEPRAVTVNTSGTTVDWYGAETPKRLN